MTHPLVRLFGVAFVLAFTSLAVEAASGGGVQASGFSALLADRSTYQLGDQIRLCWLIPTAGNLTLTDHDASGSAQVLRSGPDNGNGCVGGKITGPVGHTCEVLDFDTPRGTGSMQTCFEVTDTPAPEEQPAASQPQLTRGEVSGHDDTELGIEGAGFQTFSNAAHGVTLAVQGPDGSEVDSDELFPSADGTLHVVIHTANYAAGDYKVSARYTFLTALTGGVNQVRTQMLADGVPFSVE
jgi:hypothetical protein